MMKSIKTRLIAYFMLVIVITVIILEVLLVSIIKQNYYKNLEDTLHNQIKVSSDIYLRYFSDISLHDNILNNVDTFWKQTPAQVEIVDLSGKVLMDSIGIIHSDALDTPDVKDALNDKFGKWIGKVDYDNEKVMAVSFPLKSGNSTVGVLRFITSLKEVNKEIDRITGIFIFIGVIVILLSGLISFLFASSIVGPLKGITRVAEKMAVGDFKVKCDKKHEDEIGKLSDTLNFMADEIVKKDQLKNDFISSVSHELRTPLTSIKGWAVTLKNGNLEDKEMLLDGLDIIETESDRLTSMVEELLDFSRFVSGKVITKKEKIEIRTLMEHIEIQLRPRAERDGVEFEVICGMDTLQIISDANRLKQIFINILDNAFRFTPPGGKVLFKAKVEGNKLVLSINDTGCGIPPDELPMVKEKFFKGKSSKSRNGIGLSICDELVKLLGGTLEIKSELDKGTEVLVTLPVQEGE